MKRKNRDNRDDKKDEKSQGFISSETLTINLS